MGPGFTIFTKRYQALLPQSNEDDHHSRARNDSETAQDGAKIPYASHQIGFWLSTINTTLLSLCLLVLILLLLKVNGFDRTPGPYLQSSGSNTFTTHLGRDTGYMTLDHQYDSLWDVMLAEHLGEFVTPDDQYKRGEYSMFHQLRCLARFRLAMQQASEGRNIGKDFRDDHWAHCMDYMRRVILCNADRTIERPRIALPQSDGAVHIGIEGTEEMRICRPIQPMCDELAARGIANAPCIAELNNTLLPWKVPA